MLSGLTTPGLKEPGEKKLDMKNELVFPTEHVRRIIAARE